MTKINLIYCEHIKHDMEKTYYANNCYFIDCVDVHMYGHPYAYKRRNGSSFRKVCFYKKINDFSEYKKNIFLKTIKQKEFYCD